MTHHSQLFSHQYSQLPWLVFNILPYVKEEGQEMSETAKLNQRTLGEETWERRGCESLVHSVFLINSLNLSMPFFAERVHA